MRAFYILAAGLLVGIMLGLSIAWFFGLFPGGEQYWLKPVDYNPFALDGWNI